MTASRTPDSQPPDSQTPAPQRDDDLRGEPRDQFLSEEDLSLRELTEDELIRYWNLWLRQAQASNDRDAQLYSHGVFLEEPRASRSEKRDSE